MYNAIMAGEKNLSFVDFYDRNGIMPVTQNVNDPKFVARRHYLYRTLGIPLSLITDMKVLEFGPGGGYNAQALAKSLKCSYWCVEGSRVGSNLILERFQKKLLEVSDFRLFNSEFMKFETEQRFDLVIAEGCVPGQIDPISTLKHIARFVREGGFLVITVTSRAGQLSEILRSVYALTLRDRFKNEYDYKVELERIFSSHLLKLGTSTRNVKDWVDDNIIQRWHARKADFDLLEAIAALPEFEIQHTNPESTLDLEWYKHYLTDSPAKSERVYQSFPQFNLLYLDIRIQPKEVFVCSEDDIKELNGLIYKVYSKAQTILNMEISPLALNELAVSIKELMETPFISRIPTARALTEFYGYLSDGCSQECELLELSEWWGRGQQYASFHRTMIRT
jgi:SAM-dependent methyltransferase